eukprot:m.58666 g.58666  ORF g.58666 m.58666 type:complete len:163 (-) comp12892_c0_seq1:947-1435(-)
MAKCHRHPCSLTSVCEKSKTGQKRRVMLLPTAFGSLFPWVRFHFQGLAAYSSADPVVQQVVEAAGGGAKAGSADAMAAPGVKQPSLQTRMEPFITLTLQGAQGLSEETTATLLLLDDDELAGLTVPLAEDMGVPKPLAARLVAKIKGLQAPNTAEIAGAGSL